MCTTKSHSDICTLYVSLDLGLLGACLDFHFSLPRDKLLQIKKQFLK